VIREWAGSRSKATSLFGITPVLNADQLVAVKRQTVDAVGSYVAWPRDLGDRAG
jgi:hypothetical protein